MTQTARTTETEAWATVAARAADSKKATDTVLLRMTDLLAVTDIFVITSAANVRQVKTITEEIEARIKASGGPSPYRVEGLTDAQWVLMDYGDFVVHVFLEETRGLYDLERLWADAPQLAWSASEPAAVR